MLKETKMKNIYLKKYRINYFRSHNEQECNNKSEDILNQERTKRKYMNNFGQRFSNMKSKR